MKILFICKNNAFRSQVAEIFFNSLAKGSSASSAGTNVALKGREGAALPDETVAFMGSISMDASRLRIKQATPKMIEEADRVIVIMKADERRQFVPGWLATSPKTQYWEIENPIDTSYETHAKIGNQVVDKVKKLLREIG